MPANKCSILSVTVVCLGCLYGCSSSGGNQELAYSALDTTLSMSNELLIGQSESLLMNLEEKSREPRYSFKVAFYLRLGRQVDSLTRGLNRFIDSIKFDLKNTFNNESASEANDALAVSHFFQTDRRGKSLFDSLFNYEMQLLALDSGIRKYLIGKLPIIKLIRIFRQESRSDINQFFRNLRLPVAFTSLVQFQNNLLLTEIITLQFFRNNLADFPDDDFSKFSTIVALNAATLRIGDSLTVYAGLGEFKVNANLKLWINGQYVEAGTDGIAVYSFTPQAKPGTFSLPLKIVYYDLDGIQKKEERQITYTLLPR